MIQLRDYQITGAKQCVDRLQKYGIAYLAWEVRLGKTLTALQAANDYGAKNVLFLTKKTAVTEGTIQRDYDSLAPSFQITIINNESLHKVTDNDYDLLISDEHHRNGSYPKANKTTKAIKERFSHLPMIFLSGTPAIESSSQWFHQFWISKRSPWARYTNFYRWANDYIIPKIKYLGAIKVNDYSGGIDEKIMPDIEHLIITYTQKQAGFKAEITETVLTYKMNENIAAMVKQLLRDSIIKGRTENIIAETAAAMMSKVHQIENGTVITDAGNAYILDTTKAECIKKHFEGQKIAIFYYFQKELDLLKQVFGDTLTTDINRFNTENINFAIQQVRGSEAVSLKAADSLVYYNHHYSGRLYAQGRDRMTTKEREENNVYFVMAKDSINERIYKAVKAKKRYNEKLFMKDYKYDRATTTK